MPQPPAQPDESALRVLRCKEGDLRALGELRTECQDGLAAVLRARGASAGEAEDILADLWADCVPGAAERPSLLEKFSGRTTLPRWLATVATNRWLDFKRRQARLEPLSAEDAQGETLVREGQETPLARPEGDSSLAWLLEESLRAAFGRASAQALVLLRLVYLYDLSQREVGRMLGWSESKVSRYLSEALRQLQEVTLSEMHRRDRWLELSWQDFVDLCEAQQIGFL
ncbi:MAG TPA: RNA polymerase sigma factor [Verrucomicrobiae bacterium]|nr:RNA polymerase sigma factor [Verrucomicrobiae bacterium]